MTQVGYPYRFDSRGRTREAGEEEHVRDLIEQVLFTSPGERVNRPTFGSNLRQLVFAPNSGPLAAATQSSVQAALQQWLGEVIQVESVTSTADEATLEVTVQYTIRRTRQRRTETFTAGVNT